MGIIWGIFHVISVNVACKNSLSGLRSEVLIGLQSSYIVLAIVYE